MNLLIFAAIEHGQTRRLEHLLDDFNNSQLNLESDYKKERHKISFLIKALSQTQLSEHQYMKMLDLILGHGADAEIFSLNAYIYALISAQTKKQEQNSSPYTVIRKLVTAGADVNYCSIYRPRPIVDAARYRRWDVVEVLLHYGAYPQLKVAIWGRGFETENLLDFDENTGDIIAVKSDEKPWRQEFIEKANTEFNASSLLLTCVRFIRNPRNRDMFKIEDIENILPNHVINRYLLSLR